VNIPPITIPNCRPKYSKSIPVFRPKWLKNHTLWGGTTYIPDIGEYPPPQVEMTEVYDRGGRKGTPRWLESDG